MISDFEHSPEKGEGYGVKAETIRDRGVPKHILIQEIEGYDASEIERGVGFYIDEGSLYDTGGGWYKRVNQ